MLFPKTQIPKISSDVNHTEAKNAKTNISSHLAG